MTNVEELLESLNNQPKAATSSKKRKWREIEQLKEKFQLERELRAYEDSLEYMLDEF